MKQNGSKATACVSKCDSLCGITDRLTFSPPDVVPVPTAKGTVKMNAKKMSTSAGANTIHACTHCTCAAAAKIVHILLVLSKIITSTHVYGLSFICDHYTMSKLSAAVRMINIEQAMTGCGVIVHRHYIVP